jgi:hypothetical protein
MMSSMSFLMESPVFDGFCYQSKVGGGISALLSLLTFNSGA